MCPRSRRVDSGVPWASLRTFSIVEFSLVRPFSRWVYSGSFGSLGCAMGVVISIRVRFGGRWVHSVLFSSVGCVMGSVMFIRGRWIHSGAPLGHWVHLESLHSFRCTLGSLGLFGVVDFIRVRPGGRWVR